MRNQTKLTLEKLQPSVFPDLGSQAAFKLQLGLANSEWFVREELEQNQLTNLKKLVHFAAREIPYWRARLNVEGILRATHLPDALTLLPTQSRADVINNGEALRAVALPPGQVSVGELRTSGSTGGVVSIHTTNLAILLQHVITLREHLWARRDFSLPIASVRRFARGIAELPNGSEASYWDVPSVYPFPTGPGYQLNTHNTSLDQIWDWLTRIGPAYLLTYPSIVRGLAEDVRKQGCLRLPLKSITTIGEAVDEELREITTQILNLRIQDIYSSQEAGTMAIQCPDLEGYHVQSETVILEILDDRNRACTPGEIGRVVVTPLFNYATPLFRYEMGDFAEAGSPCACGRGLPVLNRVVGRRRNLLTLADGTRFWPSLGARHLHKIVGIRQHQYRQTAPDV